jgi:hypothetical protein
MAVLIQRRARVQLPRFLPDGDAGGNGDDGGEGGGIMLPALGFERQTGPFNLPPPGDGGGGLGPYPSGPFCLMTDQGWVCFNQVGASLQFSQKFVSIPQDPNLFSCNQLTAPVPDGDVHSTIGGNIVRNPATGQAAGRLDVAVAAAGLLPAGGANAPVLNPLRTGAAYTESAALSLVTTLGGYLVADQVRTGFSGVGYERVYTGGRAMGGVGYFVQGFMNTIGCISGGVVSYLDPYDPITVPDLFGPAANDQTNGGFVAGGGGGGTYLGNASRARLTFVSPTNRAVTFFNYLLTPTNGDQVYHLLFSEILVVVPGTVTTILRPFPPVNDANVVLESWELLYNEEQSEDWEGYEPAAVLGLGTSGSWPFAITLGGGGPWDDFENYMGNSTTNVYNLLTGYWGPAYFSSVDGLSAEDDFEAYATGTIVILNHGLGWPTVGTTATSDIFQAYDDLESYAAGAIAELPDPFDALNRWAGIGSFVTNTYSAAWDDFESYPAGVILDLPVPADPTNLWAGIGTFGF